mgnify:CR=1 FL=1
MDKNKKERITGLVIGLIGLIILWWLKFDELKCYTYTSRPELCTPMGEFLYDIFSTKGARQPKISAERNLAEFFYYLTQLIYIGAVWHYRACIGHWAIKSVKVFYKKL